MRAGVELWPPAANASRSLPLRGEGELRRRSFFQRLCTKAGIQYAMLGQPEKAVFPESAEPYGTGSPAFAGMTTPQPSAYGDVGAGLCLTKRDGAANARHREERSDAAIQSPETRPFIAAGRIAPLGGVATLAMTAVGESVQIYLDFPASPEPSRRSASCRSTASHRFLAYMLSACIRFAWSLRNTYL